MDVGNAFGIVGDQRASYKSISINIIVQLRIK